MLPRNATPSHYFNPSIQGSWLITGGLGGLGLLVARWLLGSGASHIILCDVAGVHRAANHRNLLGSFPGLVSVVSANVGSCTEAELALDACNGSALAGIVHAAGVLQDALLLKQTAGSFRAVLAGKVVF